MKKYKALFDASRSFTGRAARLKAFPSAEAQVDFDESLSLLMAEANKIMGEPVENKD